MPETTPKSLAPTAPLAPPAKPTGWNRPLPQINAMIRKAEAGDASALAEVKEMLVRPGTADMLGGNIAKVAVQALTTRYAGNSPVTREAAERKLDELRAELSGQNPTPLEKLLVDRVLATWLHLHHVEIQLARKESVTLPLGLYYQKVISAAQKRYISAIKGLADVRKLALPVLQVNIAKKQVNVAGGAALAPG